MKEFLFYFEMATTRKFIPKEIEHNKVLKDLEHAVDIIVDMKNMSELSVGLAYSAILFDNEDIAYEVSALESEMDSMKYELQHWVLETAKHVEDVNRAQGNPAPCQRLGSNFGCSLRDCRYCPQGY